MELQQVRTLRDDAHFAVGKSLPTVQDLQRQRHTIGAAGRAALRDLASVPGVNGAVRPLALLNKHGATSKEGDGERGREPAPDGHSEVTQAGHVHRRRGLLGEILWRLHPAVALWIWSVLEEKDTCEGAMKVSLAEGYVYPRG